MYRNDKEQENFIDNKEEQDVIKNAVKLAVKITVEAESRGLGKNLSMLPTKQEDKMPLLGMDWLREFIVRYEILKVRRQQPTNQKRQNIRKIWKTNQNEPNNKRYRE